MEPEDLLGFGDEGAPAGAEELRTIVARAGRRRLRAAAGGLTAALLVGGGAGYALSNHSSSGQTVATAPAAGSPGGSQAAVASSSPNLSASASASAIGGFSTERLTPLFTRTVGSIDIRGFAINQSGNGAVVPNCGVIGPRFQAEVSTSKMVGTADNGFLSSDPSKALSAINTAIIGVAEGDPVLVVTASTGSGVAQVRETGFSGGATDTMAPVRGWVALAGPTSTPSSPKVGSSPPKVGTITALSASGKVLAAQSVTWPLIPSAPATPRLPIGAPSSSGSSSGSSGSALVSPALGCVGGGSVGGGTTGPGGPVCASSGGTVSVLPAVTSGGVARLAPATSPPTVYLCRRAPVCTPAHNPAGGGGCPLSLCPTPAGVTSTGSAAVSGVASGSAQIVCSVPMKAASSKAAG